MIGNLHGAFFDVHVQSAQDVGAALADAVAFTGMAHVNGFCHAAASSLVIGASDVNGRRRRCRRLRRSVHHIFRHPNRFKSKIETEFIRLASKYKTIRLKT